jgi:hypothetical protein
MYQRGGRVRGPLRLMDPQQRAHFRESFLALVSREGFLQRMLLHAINHRVQDFPDPLTTTLVLMATVPLQCVLCESGLLLFKTNLLPVMPYGLLHSEELEALHALLLGVPEGLTHETVESNGQYTLTALPFTHNQGASASVHALCKRTLLMAFIDVMQLHSTSGGGTNSNSSSNDPVVSRTLNNIVLQRFWSRVSTPSEVVMAVMQRLNPPPPPPAGAVMETRMEVEVEVVEEVIKEPVVNTTTTSTTTTTTTSARQRKMKPRPVPAPLE